MSQETEALAKRFAEAQHLSIEGVVRQALEEKARAAGMEGQPSRPNRRRLSVEDMLAVGTEIAAMPLLDRRSPQEIMDDLNTP